MEIVKKLFVPLQTGGHIGVWKHHLPFSGDSGHRLWLRGFLECVVCATRSSSNQEIRETTGRVYLLSDTQEYNRAVTGIDCVTVQLQAPLNLVEGEGVYDLSEAKTDALVMEDFFRKLKSRLELEIAPFLLLELWDSEQFEAVPEWFINWVMSDAFLGSLIVAHEEKGVLQDKFASSDISALYTPREYSSARRNVLREHGGQQIHKVQMRTDDDEMLGLLVNGLTATRLVSRSSSPVQELRERSGYVVVLGMGVGVKSETGGLGTIVASLGGGTTIVDIADDYSQYNPWGLSQEAFVEDCCRRIQAALLSEIAPILILESWPEKSFAPIPEWFVEWALSDEHLGSLVVVYGEEDPIREKCVEAKISEIFPPWGIGVPSPHQKQVTNES